MFDAGETLVDESRLWAVRAQLAGVTPFALMGIIGALIESGEEHQAAWRMLGVQDPPPAPPIQLDDLYPDALDCIRALRRAGFLVGVAGNQPEGVQTELRTAGLEPDFIASSAMWGISKPAARFFARIIETCKRPSDSILYVGDRLDNDVLPARAAGMRTAHLRRGPWGFVHARRQEAELADLRVENLREIVDVMCSSRERNGALARRM